MKRFAHLELVLVVLVAGAGVARADDDSSFDVDRPDFTNGPTVVPVHALQLEAGWTRDNNKVGPDSNGVSSRLTFDTVGEGLVRLGIAPRLELRIGIPTWEHSEFRGIGRSDFSTASVGGKLFLGDAAHTSFGLIANLSFPDNGLPSSQQAALAIEHAFGPLDLSANLVATLTDQFGRFSRPWSGAASLSGGFDLAPRLDGFVEWYDLLSEGGLPSHFVDTGVGYRITPHLKADVRFGLALPDPSDDHFFGAGFATRW